MKNSLAAALALCLGYGLFTPCLADDDTLEKVVDGSLVVTRLGGAGAGMVLGMPVAAARQTIKLYKSWTTAAADKVGGSDLGPACAAASLVTLPVSMVAGTALGIYYGGKNGIVEGFNAPFSPASFSLDENIED